MKIKRILATALSVSMLMGQGVYAAETSMDMENIPESAAETVQESQTESLAETIEETVAESVSESIAETIEETAVETVSESQTESLEETNEIKETETEALQTIEETVVETAEETETEQEIMPEASAAQVEISTNTFPDKNFRQYILDTIDKDSNKKLSEEEINSTANISVPNMGIQSLKGIEFFTSLETLDGRNNQLTSADLSSNTMLSSVDLSGNVYDLGAIGGIYPVSELPEGFDISKTSEWTGAECADGSLKNINSVHWKANIGYTYDLGNGHTTVFSLNCTLDAPEDAIEFKDRNLLKALLSSCDTNNDGFITKEELGSVKSLLLGYYGIEDISGLQYAVNLTVLDLSYNENLKDISALANLTNLEFLDLDSTAVSDIRALSNLTKLWRLDLYCDAITDISVLSNLINLESLQLGGKTVSDISALYDLEKLERVFFDTPLVTDEQYMELMGITDSIEMFTGDSRYIKDGPVVVAAGLDHDDAVKIIDGEENIEYYQYDVNYGYFYAKKAGKTHLHIKLGSIEKDIEIIIKDADANPDIGKETDVEIYYPKPDISWGSTNDEAVILDNNGQLWSLYPKTEKVQSDVKEYVSQWVYDRRECKHYSYVIDKNDSLWMEGVKKLDDVQKVDFPYALDKQNILHNLHTGEQIPNVKEWVPNENNNGTMFKGTSYILKMDGTLWYASTFSSIYEEDVLRELDTGVERLVGKYGYIKTDGTYYSFSRNVIAENVKDVNADIGGYYDTNGDYYVPWYSDYRNVGKMDVREKISFYQNSQRVMYFLTTDDKLYCYDEVNGVEFIASEVESLGLVEGSNLALDYLYKTKDGRYFTVTGEQMKEGMVKRANSTYPTYTMHLTKDGDYEARKNGAVRMTKVKDIWTNQGRGFALRTDGTIWDITGNPEKVFESNMDILVSGVTLNRNALTFTAKGQSNTLKATVSPADATDKGLTWSSSNTKVAKVNNSGVVTPVANGTAVITVKTKDGGKTATCKVTVKFPTVATLTNLRAVTGGPSKVKLTWNAVSGAEGYLVYAQKNGQYGYVGMTTKGTTYTDTKALTNDYNFYWVFPYVKDAKGNMYTGGCQSYKYAKGGVCPAVTNLKASSEIGQVRLTWKASAGAEGYLVYGKTAIGKYGYIGMTTKGTTYVHKSASKTEYNFYWVFPYHKDAQGKMIVGGTPKYVYGKAR